MCHAMPWQLALMVILVLSVPGFALDLSRAAVVAVSPGTVPAKAAAKAWW